MKDYRQGIDEIVFSNGLEDQSQSVFISEKDKLINQERDLSKDATLAAPRSTVSRIVDEARASAMSLDSGSSATNTTNILAASLTRKLANNLNPADRKKRVYANYEHLLELENSKC